MRKRLRGQSLVEFTFVGIPLMFTLVCIFEISRGMWIYGTLNHAAKQGVRYAIVHGINCSKNTNACTVQLGPANNKCNNTVSTIAEVIMCAGAGLDPTNTKVTFISANGPLGPYSLNAVPTGSWPPTGGNEPGQALTIQITTPFKSALSMFWPGASPVKFASGTFGASSSDQIQF